jgi:hypothetical protein
MHFIAKEKDAIEVVHLVVFLEGQKCLLVNTLPNCDDK